MIPDAIASLFGRLDAERIPYVVLRGYLPLDELARSQDIDVYIARQDRRRAGAVIARAGWLERRHQTGRYPHRFYDTFDVPGRLCTMLDVVYGLAYGDRLYRLARPERVLASAEATDGIRVPHPWVAMFTFALHVTLDKEALSDQNARRGRLLRAEAERRPDGVTTVRRDFGAEAAAFTERFARAVAGEEPPDLRALRTEALALPCLRPARVLARFDDLRTRVRARLVRPLRVAVLGMDGAGKSTLIERARSLPSPLPIGSAYLGYNQFATPLFRALLARIERLSAGGRGDGVRVKLLDKARALWWPFELHARMRRAERARSIVLYDRYPFPASERDEAPTTLPGRIMLAYERIWTALLPAPELMLVLDGAPEVIWARKREYPFEEFMRARARLLRLAESFAGERHIIATDRPLESSVGALTEALRTSLALRRRLYRTAP